MLKHYHVGSDLHFSYLPWTVHRYYNHKVFDGSPENLYIEDGYNNLYPVRDSADLDAGYCKVLKEIGPYAVRLQYFDLLGKPDFIRFSG